MTTDLRALLGDRMEPTLDAAARAVQTRVLRDTGYDAMPDAHTYAWSRLMGGTALAAVLPDLLATAKRDGAWDAIEHLGDELGWTHTPHCATRVSIATSPPTCICHAVVLRDMRARFNYPEETR